MKNENIFVECGSYIWGVLLSLKANFSFNVLISFLVASLSFLFGADSLDILFCFLFINIFDFITGTMASKIKGDLISSNRMIHSVYKLLAYSIAISASHFLDVISGLSMLPVQYTTITYLAVVETVSVFENLGKMGFNMPNKILNNLKEYIEDKK
ncbi:MAG: phage holin family protein [Clostridia bacterium]|nr:phage holin family protein [Clostridia bacterium]